MPKKYTAVFSLSGEDGKSYKEIVLIWQKIHTKTIKEYISPKPQAMGFPGMFAINI